MSQVYLSLQAARHLHLAAQGLLRKPVRRPRPDDILSTIRKISLLQIDTINVVARSPWIVLFSRLGAFPFPWLDEALAQGELIEYWAHEACFLPREDFSLIRHRMLNPEAMGWKYRPEWMAEHQDEIAELLHWIERNGPVRAADFDNPHKGTSGWWAWKPHKRHLEGLFTAGKVMVTARRNFQRVYDLTSRVMPHWDDTLHGLPQASAEQQMLINSAKSLGIFSPEWLADYYRLKNVPVKQAISQWEDEQVVRPVQVEKLGCMWVHQDLFPLLEKAERGALSATHTTVLSPFDPVVWDRRRAEQLFDFSYRLECYTPAEKRRYGYFVLPLLHCGRLIGRMDAKMHRNAGCLEVIALWLESDVRVTATLEKCLREAIVQFGTWQGAECVKMGRLPELLCQRWEPEWQIP